MYSKRLFVEGDEKKYATVIEKFEDHFVPKKRRRMLFMSEYVFIAVFKKKEKRWRLLFEISTNWQNTVNSEHKEMSK